MRDTADQYEARLRAYAANEDPISMQREAPAMLAGLIEGVPDELLRRRPASGKWSIRAILAHLAEDELVSSWRYRQMIEHSGAALPGFDQDEWARRGDHDKWTPRDAIEMFRLVRMANLRIFDKLIPQEVQRYGVH